MALPRVEVSIGITLNVGNYESVRAEARFGQDGDDWNNVVAEAKVGLAAALDGVEKMLTTRKEKLVNIKPGPIISGTPSARLVGPRRAGR